MQVHADAPRTFPALSVLCAPSPLFWVSCRDTVRVMSAHSLFEVQGKYIAAVGRFTSEVDADSDLQRCPKRALWEVLLLLDFRKKCSFLY